MGQFPRLNSSQGAAGMPVNEFLVGDLSVAADYTYDTAMRGGTDASATRLVLARGKIPFDEDNTTANKTIKGTITYASTTPANGGPVDGDPNFGTGTNVHFVFGFEQITGAPYHEWKANQTFPVYAWSAVLRFNHYTLFQYTIQFYNATGARLKGNLVWYAIGEPSSGE